MLIMIRTLDPTTCTLPPATRERLTEAVWRAVVELDALPPERLGDEDNVEIPTGLLVAVPGPGDATVWTELLGAGCPALVHLGFELPRIEAWARGLQRERDNRPDPPIWPWAEPVPGRPAPLARPENRARALRWWVEARARRPPSEPPWHRVSFPNPRTAWTFLWRDPGADNPEGSADLAAALRAANAIVTAWSAPK